MLSLACTVLLVLVFVVAACAAFGAGAGTAAAATILLALAIHHRARKTHWTGLLRVAAAALWLLALICLLVPAAIAARDVARCSQCRVNLAQIGLALRNYWDSHRCFPPISTYDKAGRPMHSWRLLIKPYLDCSATYQAYDFKQPWDAPSNRKVLETTQSMYSCPADQTAYARDCTMTSYLAVVGREAPWRRPEGRKSEAPGLKGQTESSFLVIEMANTGVHWTEPKDIHFDDTQAMRSLVAGSPHRRINGYFFSKTPAVNAVLVDGDRLFLFPWDSSESVLSGLVPPSEAQYRAPRGPKEGPPECYVEELKLHWPHCIGLPVWIVAFGLLIYRVGQASRPIRPHNESGAFRIR